MECEVYSKQATLANNNLNNMEYKIFGIKLNGEYKSK